MLFLSAVLGTTTLFFFWIVTDVLFGIRLFFYNCSKSRINFYSLNFWIFYNYYSLSKIFCFSFLRPPCSVAGVYMPESWESISLCPTLTNDFFVWEGVKFYFGSYPGERDLCLSYAERSLLSIMLLSDCISNPFCLNLDSTTYVALKSSDFR